MSLSTFSIFYYGYEVTSENQFLNFSEGGGELAATVEVGSYSMTDLMIAVQTALNAAGADTYVVSVDRSTRLVTIENTVDNFELLTSSGTSIGSSIFSLLGFSGADKTGADTYTGTAATGSAYEPQFVLQDYVSPDDFKRSVQASVNTSANGDVEIVRFGIQSFIQMNMKFNTNKAMDGTVIKTNPSGVDALRDFMQFCITKSPLEFMADIGSRSTFYKVILESTPESRDGTGYKLNEQYNQNLPEFFDTGVLLFRVVS